MAYYVNIINSTQLAINRDHYKQDYLCKTVRIYKITVNQKKTLAEKNVNNLKGTRCLGSVELVFEKRL